ncbi:MAG: hypothetical protein COA37_17695 [Hoeflea sp.]|nr:MAG: hypothetical protein COA37_17695 [Hoeflea sp.]
MQEAVNKAHENLLAASQLLRDSPANLMIPKLDNFLDAEERPRSVVDAVKNIKKMAVGLDDKSVACAETIGLTLLRAEGAVTAGGVDAIAHTMDRFNRWLGDINTAITTKNFDKVPESADIRNDPEIQEIDQLVLRIGAARALLEQTYADMIIRRQTLIADFEEAFCVERSTIEALRAMTWRDWSSAAFQPIMAKLDPTGAISATMKFRESFEARRSPKLGTDGGDTQTILMLEQGLREEGVVMAEIERLASKIEVEAKKLGF